MRQLNREERQEPETGAVADRVIALLIAEAVSLLVRIGNRQLEIGEELTRR